MAPAKVLGTAITLVELPSQSRCQPSQSKKRASGSFLTACDVCDEDTMEERRAMVFVRGLSSVTSSVDVELDGTVEQLKQAIEALDGLPSELQGIVFSGKSLQDECCLLH
ncbi:CEP52, partial [Haematococcus lacustris]